MKDKHVIEALGKTEVVIENGKVTSVGDPLIDYCPIFDKIDNAKQLDKDFIKWNIEKRIREFGMCTANRVVKMPDMMSFGISEILKTNKELDLIDCVVGVCEGAGTLLITDPEIIQGVGGRVSGLVSTTPIPEVIEKLGVENVINPETAELNPVKGLEMAIEKGFKNIAITILPSKEIAELREYPLPKDVNVYIFVAHTTNATDEEVETAFKNADVITACTSGRVRDYAEKEKVYYSGSKVPIFAITPKGREFLDNRLEKIGKAPTINDYPLDLEKHPNPLI
ncbi:methanogenesis marker 8 protein [uncultured Methanobrevibacter sp.]|uniref:methanogenesis marker 8 protein n=1 Tax=uncultured Methanobrevibacter sp. TaxID=253161 RepID=UPI0025E1F5A4|nr:methanogenesis marker 8 protein [uncultured Methanobrevibacter sp.]